MVLTRFIEIDRQAQLMEDETRISQYNGGLRKLKTKFTDQLAMGWKLSEIRRSAPMQIVYDLFMD